MGLRKDHRNWVVKLQSFDGLISYNLSGDVIVATHISAHQ